MENNLHFVTLQSLAGHSGIFTWHFDTLKSPDGAQWSPSQKHWFIEFSFGVPNTFEGGTNLKKCMKDTNQNQRYRKPVDRL